MFAVLSHLNYLIVLAVAALGFLLGWVWYSPVLFSRAWMKEMNFAPADFKKSPAQGMLMLAGAFALTFLSTTVLALLVTWHEQLGATGALGGLKMGLLVGLGLVAVRQGVNSIFAMKSLKLYVIVAAYDVVLCALQGALLGLWLWPK